MIIRRSPRSAPPSAVGALAAVKEKKEKLSEQTFVFFGAGSAGIGIADLIACAISEENKRSKEEARKRIWLVDSKGLVYKGRADVNAEKEPYAHEYKQSIESLADVVAELKATVLVGVSSVPKAFNQKVCENMTKNTEHPIIFALSNPTSQCECTAEDAYKWTKGKCWFASGTSYDPVTLEGKKFVPGQCNNSYIFPGIALAIVATVSRRVPVDSFFIAAKALAKEVSDEDLKQGTLYPALEKSRKVALNIATEVATYLYDQNLAMTERPEDIKSFLDSTRYCTDYPTFVSQDSSL